MKNLFLSILLLFVIIVTVFGDNKDKSFASSDFEIVNSIQFDVSKIPFSCYGSYLSLIAQNQQSGSQELSLYDLTGNILFDPNKRILKIAPVLAEELVPVSYEGSPVELKGIIKDGNFNIYYENPRILHICAEKADIQLSGNWGNEILPVPGYPMSYMLYNKNIILTAKTGKINFSRNDQEEMIRLERDNQGKLDIVIEQYYGDWMPKHYTENKDQSVSKLTKNFADWYRKVPSMPDKYEAPKKLAAYINWSCIHEPRENMTRYGMAMSKGHMSYIWSWDHCFNAMGLSYHYPSLSWDQLMIMFDHQNPETGAIPDLISSESIAWKFKKPPIHGWTLSLLTKQFKLSKAQKQEAYTKLSKWTNYWLICRDTDKNGLPQYYHGCDSGWDNGSAFDTGTPAEGPDLAAFLILQMEELSILAEQLSYPKEAKEWKAKSRELMDKMIKTFWNGKKFVTRRTSDGMVNTKSQSLMSYLPIVLGKRLPDNIYKKMVEDLKIEGYLLTPYGLASESPQSPTYHTDGYWQGPIWAPTIVIICQGLRDGGEEELARMIAERYCNTCLKSGFSENFDALTGKLLRDSSYTWTSSAFLVLAHEYLNSK